MKLILRFLRPHWKLCAATIVLLTLDVMGGLVIPTLVAEMLNAGTSGAGPEAIVRTGVRMAAVSLAAGACAILGGYACAVLSARIGQEMREALYAKSLKLSIYDFRQFGTASITTRTISDITTIQFALTTTLQLVVPVPVICLAAMALTFRLDVWMGVLLLAVICAVLLLAWRIMRSASPLFRKLQKLLDRMSAVLLENLTGVRVVRAFCSERREEARMISAFSDYADTSIRANLLFANLDGLSFFFINFFIVAAYWLCGGQIYARQISDRRRHRRHRVRHPGAVLPDDGPDGDPHPAPGPGVLRAGPAGAGPHARRSWTWWTGPRRRTPRGREVLAFRDVSFRFQDAEEDTLSHLDFVCRRGETTAVIGGTGSGKSTVASLILRFHDVTGGAIQLNGTDIRQMPQAALRDHLGYVQQKAWLFSGTIRGEPAVQPPGRHGRGADARRRRGPGRGLHPLPAGRAGRLCGPGGHQLLRRPEAAAVHCPGPGEEAGAVYL